ncbi:MAG: AmmeMemoRadiSam system protein B [Acidobacteria bacterium]|nr:AmmeMemoRadiSam system protein B [Acidobacteriota bacterium]
MTRQPAAAEFYAGDCAGAAERFLRDFAAPAEPTHIVAGVVPHAGWEYSGAVAAQVFGVIQRKQPVETFVIFGAIHRRAGRNAVYARGEWATPLGPVQVDEELAARILDATTRLLADDPQAHAGEHAIEVQLPFIRHWFPQASVVPISVSPDTQAVEIGQRVGDVLKKLGRETVVIGSTDLTHYGELYQFSPQGAGERARQWMRGNDERIIDLAVDMKAEQIVKEARQHQNACGAGALAATVAAAARLGSQHGVMLDYRTSFDVAPEPVFRMAVGYSAIVF